MKIREVIVRWRPPVCGHHVHVMIYRGARIVASESGAVTADVRRAAMRASKRNL